MKNNTNSMKQRKYSLNIFVKSAYGGAFKILIYFLLCLFYWYLLIYFYVDLQNYNEMSD